MTNLNRFNTPAGIHDLSDTPDKQAKLNALWNATLNSFTQSSISGGEAPLDNNRDFYVNPLTTDLANAVHPPPVTWTAFPNRILLTFPNASRREQLQYADDGPPDPNYRPRGPRGWQDEYCEWSVTRNAEGKITKVMFTCENPEYWHALWLIDRDRVLDLYRELVSPAVQLSDLAGPTDPNTGQPSYNPTNKWNNSATSGAVHLVSPPNSLSAEIYLAAAATIVREHNGEVVTNQSQLIECSLYGTPGRNSDPHIGGTVNSIVRPGGVKVTLKDPVGLYIQEPVFDQTWRLPTQAPAHARASDYWTIVRGHRRTDPNEPDFILHALYEVPADQGFTVSDIMIEGVPILFGSQITQKFQIGLAAIGIPTTDPHQQPRPCLGRIQAMAAAVAGAEAPVEPAHMRVMEAFMRPSTNRS